MSSFAHDSKTNQRHTDSSSFSKPSHPHSSRHHQTSATALLQRSLGNQNVQKLLQNTSPDASHAEAAIGTTGIGSTFPYLNDIQKSFGRHSISNIQAYTNETAARSCSALGAKAYATGNKVAFASYPSLRTAAHEAAHVIQQAAGIKLKGGVGETGDRYERHADIVADIVVQKNSAEAMLGKMQAPASPPTRQAQSLQLQEDEDKEKEKEKKTPPAIDFNRKGLLGEVYKDVFGPKFIGFSQGRALRYDPTLALKGTEMTSAYSLALAGPTAYIHKGKYEDYLKGIGKLSPGGSDDIAGNVMDVLSLSGGVRIGDYFGSDLFLKHRLLPYLKADWGLFRTLGLLSLAQGAYSGGLSLSDLSKKDEDKDPNEFNNPDWLRHLGMLKFLAIDAPLKASLFKPPEVFGGLGPLTADSYKASAYSHYTAESLPKAGLDYKQSLEGGGHDFSFGLPLNLAGALTGKNDSTSVADTRDLSKYRGAQLSLWGAYQNKRPTDSQIAEGKLPYQYAEGGALGGYRGHTALFEGGALINKGVQSHFLRGGYSYHAPKDSRLSSVGLTGTYFNWSPTSPAAQGFSGDASTPRGGSAFRLSPSLAFGNLLNSDEKKLSIDAAAAIAFGSVDKARLALARIGISYKHLARDKDGKIKPDKMPVWSLAAGFSAARPQWWNPQMPMLYGAQLKGSVGPFFFGSQFHVGDNSLTESQAAAMGIKADDRKAFELFFNAGWNFDLYGRAKR